MRLLIVDLQLRAVELRLHASESRQAAFKGSSLAQDKRGCTSGIDLQPSAVCFSWRCFGSANVTDEAQNPS